MFPMVLEDPEGIGVLVRATPQRRIPADIVKVLLVRFLK
jgi:hypothetical protein